MSSFKYRMSISSDSSPRANWFDFPVFDSTSAYLYDSSGNGNTITSSLANLPLGYGFYGGLTAVGFENSGSPVYISKNIADIVPSCGASGITVLFENVKKDGCYFTLSNSDQSSLISLFVDQSTQKVGFRVKGVTDTTFEFTGLYSAISAYIDLMGDTYGRPLAMQITSLDPETASFLSVFNGVSYAVNSVQMYGDSSTFTHISLLNRHGSISVCAGDTYSYDDIVTLSNTAASIDGSISNSSFLSTTPAEQSTISNIVSSTTTYNPSSPVGSTSTVPPNANIMMFDDSSTLSDIAGMLLVVTMAFNESVVLDTILSSEVIGIVRFSDSIRFRNASVFESQVYESYSINKNTGAASRYDGFYFESFVKTKTKMYGVRKDGIYEITGYMDEDFDIESSITTGKVRFNGEGSKRLVGGYLAGDISGRTNVSVMSDAHDPWKYEVYTKDGYGNSRVKFGKGLKGYAMQFEVSNKGKIDLDSVNIDALYKSRRS